jgi:chemotaxis protein histidine kinase CheA
LVPIDPLLHGVVQGFVVEAEELSQKLTRRLLEVERSEQGDALVSPYDEIGRDLHTLKGSAATVGLHDLATLAHAMEEAVAPYRAARHPLPSPAVDTLLRCLDAFLVRLRDYADTGGTGPPLPANLAAQLSGIAGDGPAPEARRSLAAPRPQPPDTAAVDDVDEGDDDVGSSSWRIATHQVVALMREIERLREGRLRFAERKVDLDRALGALQPLGGAQAEQVRTVLGELARAMTADSDEVREAIDALEDGVKAICTQPVRTILDPLHRIVRDLARASGKEAKLSVVGGEISLDRRILAALKSALVHLLRNAVDHGIEEPDVRTARGKHREGAVVIRVEKHGNLVMIESSDDGAGISTSGVREVAAARRLASPDALDRMDAKQVHQLVFLAGLSTRGDVTETSGRGVGLDAVRSHIEDLQGHVDVHSVAGEGTRFAIALPTELGSSPVLVVAAGEQQFALPLMAVETILPCKSERVRIGRSHTMLEHGTELLRLVGLAASLGTREPEPPADGQPVLVLNAGGRRVALAVEDVVGYWDLVVRALPSELRGLPAYQGAAIVSGGRPILVLRPEWLAETASSDAESAPSPRALVVDDALTARALHRAMLEAGGYTVHVVSDAKQALERLRTTPYDVVVCDVAMEGLDGYELTSRVRGNPQTSSTPVILVSAHESEADRARGAAAGADAFLSKRECGAGRLLAEVGEAIARRKAAR